jgi:hypothetical protein
MQAKNYLNNIQVKRDCFDGTVTGIAGNVEALPKLGILETKCSIQQ